MDKRDWLELYSKDGAICPYCNTMHDPSDDNWELYDDSLTSWFCHYCEKEFSVDVHVSYSWQTEEQDDE